MPHAALEACLLRSISFCAQEKSASPSGALPTRQLEIFVREEEFADYKPFLNPCEMLRNDNLTKKKE